MRDVTAEAAGRFARVAQALTARGHDPQQVAHFLIQCLFAMFAEDAKHAVLDEPQGKLLGQRLLGEFLQQLEE